MNHEQMQTIKDFGEMLTKQIEKINKKGDISPDELQRMDKAIDIIKDISVICAMEEYGNNPEEEMYSSMGYYGRNSRGPVHDPMRIALPYNPAPMYSATGRDSMGRYSSRGYSRDGAAQKMRHDLELKLAEANTQEERDMIMRCMDALER